MERNMMLQVKSYKVLLLAALLVGAVGTASAGTPCGTNLEYEIVGGKLILTSPNSGAATIYSQAFKDHTEITEVVIPENVTHIYSAAFMGCTGLTSLIIPPAVEEIGEDAFNGCSLTSVICRPYTAPSLGNYGMGTNADLPIYVPNLGSYREIASDKHWIEYDLKFYSFLDEYDDVSAATAKISVCINYHETEIDIFRTLRKAGCFNTLTLPFNVTDIAGSPLAGAELYAFVSAEVVDGTLQLNITQAAQIAAGTPYLIQWPNTGEVLNRMHFTGITWDNDTEAECSGSGEVAFKGFYGRTHIDDDTNSSGTQHLNLFLLGNNTLYWPKEGDTSSMLGFRAYFNVVTPKTSTSPIRRDMPAKLNIIKDAPTDVEQLLLNNRPAKQLINGHLVIMLNGEQYSITGQKL